jgi:hypothetical protein
MYWGQGVEDRDGGGSGERKRTKTNGESFLSPQLNVLASFAVLTQTDLAAKSTRLRRASGRDRGKERMSRCIRGCCARKGGNAVELGGRRVSYERQVKEKRETHQRARGEEEEGNRKR